MTHDDKHNQLKRFIQEILGCGCPEEVFDSIEICSGTSKDLPECPLVSVLVGKRLLIHFLLVGKTERLSKEILTRMTDTGRTQRDDNGYNRFRLVLIFDDPQNLPASLSIEEFDRLKEDDRTHLHIHTQNEIPTFLFT